MVKMCGVLNFKYCFSVLTIGFFTSNKCIKNNLGMVITLSVLI